MGTVPILKPPEHRWACPSCHALHVTREARPHTPLHPCRAHGGVMVPFVPARSNDGPPAGSVRHVLVERGDYVNGERGLRYDPDGRPVQAVITERADGSNDCHIFAGVAVGGGASFGPLD